MGGDEPGYDEMVGRSDDPVERPFRLEPLSRSRLDDRPVFHDEGTVGYERLFSDGYHRVTYDQSPCHALLLSCRRADSLRRAVLSVRFVLRSRGGCRCGGCSHPRIRSISSWGIR